MTTTHEAAPTPGAIRSLIPARIDRLPWSPFHTRMVVALGVAWILDGLEITVASAVADLLTEPDDARPVAPPQAGLIATVYLVGEVVGALFFGRLSDKLGRKQAVHHHPGRLPGRQRPDRAHPRQRRRLARLPVRHPVHRRHGHRRRVRGDQLRDRRADPGPVPRPRRHRGQRHLLGRRDPRHARHLHLPQPVSTRTSAGGSPSCSARCSAWSSSFVRRHLPESPRWQVMHGREAEAEETIAYIEHEVEAGRRAAARRSTRARRSRSSPTDGHRLLRAARVLFKEYPQRAIYGATLMITQSFLYNAIFFTYTLVLAKFYGVGRADGAAVPHRLRGRQPGRAARCSGTCSTPSAARR